MIVIREVVFDNLEIQMRILQTYLLNSSHITNQPYLLHANQRCILLFRNSHHQTIILISHLLLAHQRGFFLFFNCHHFGILSKTQQLNLKHQIRKSWNLRSGSLCTIAEFVGNEDGGFFTWKGNFGEELITILVEELILRLEG
jgi:hypothetical protein